MKKKFFEKIVGLLDFTEEEYNQVRHQDMSTLEELIRNSIHIVAERKGGIKDVVYILNDAFNIIKNLREENKE